MKTTKTSILMSALLALTLNAPGQSWLTNGLVAYFPLDGNANDASGSNHNATALNVSWTSDRFNRTMSAGDFNGSSSYVNIPHHPDLDLTTNFTLSVWIYQRGFGGQGYRIIDKCTAGYPDGVTFDNYGCNGTGNRLRLQGAAGGPCNISGSTDYSLSSWHHIVAAVSGTIGTVYLDGHFDGSNSVGNIPSNTLDIFIGIGHPSGSTSWFNGMMDDVRIYNRALSSSEVAQLYAIESFCSPHVAQATAIMSGASVAAATLIDSGCGYTNVPSVRILGGGGTGATAIATMENGVVTGLVITSPGNGYTNAPRMLIESPPFVPSVNIAVSKVKVTQRLRVNHQYVLEASLDLATWTTTGPAFTAESESIVNEFDVDTVGRFFRLREVP